jgi:hypothetical protein
MLSPTLSAFPFWTLPTPQPRPLSGGPLSESRLRLPEVQFEQAADVWVPKTMHASPRLLSNGESIAGSNETLLRSSYVTSRGQSVTVLRTPAISGDAFDDQWCFDSKL